MSCSKPEIMTGVIIDVKCVAVTVATRIELITANALTAHVYLRLYIETFLKSIVVMVNQVRLKRKKKLKKKQESMNMNVIILSRGIC